MQRLLKFKHLINLGHPSRNRAFITSYLSLLSNMRPVRIIAPAAVIGADLKHYTRGRYRHKKLSLALIGVFAF